MTNAPGGTKDQPRPFFWRLQIPLLTLITALFIPAQPAAAAIQFDVFLGYGNDGFVREGNWFPVTCEINNDGPAFTGVVELTGVNTGGDNVRRFIVELPTDTRKRIVIPAYGTGGRFQAWDAKLRDERNKVVAEQEGLRPGADLTAEAPLIGALSRTFPGSPRLPDVPQNRKDDQPRAARFRAALFPDNPIALEGMNAIYLNSETALDLNVGQVDALQAWLHAGGHLIVGIERPGDINGSPWLLALMPCKIGGVGSVTTHGVIQQWLQKGAMSDSQKPAWRRPSNATDIYQQQEFDPAFEDQTFAIVKISPQDGRVDLELDSNPLIVSAPRGRGTVSALAFSPEKEPFRGWKNRDWFWAHLMRISPTLYSKDTHPVYSSRGIDSAFGVMIDTKQVRKLPVKWLLLLLVVYLLVIGPLDQWWLKKINRQMLTWITFPCYVVLFSVLIYWIGYMLRAGETEWNELHVVDVYQRGDKAELRGRTFASLYSPSNAEYKLAGVQPVSALRGEFMGSRSGSSDISRAAVVHQGDGYDATVYVPVWTSQLYINDWWQSADLPLKASLKESDGKLTGTISNLLDRELTGVRVAFGKKIHDMGALAAGETRNVSLPARNGTNLADFVRSNAGRFGRAIDQRRQAFGGSNHNQIPEPAKAAMAASFIRQLRVSGKNNSQDNFTTPVGFEISDAVNRGHAIVLAWGAGQSLTGKMNQFSPRRGRKDTLLRLSVPAGAELQTP